MTLCQTAHPLQHSSDMLQPTLTSVHQVTTVPKLVLRPQSVQLVATTHQKEPPAWTTVSIALWTLTTLILPRLAASSVEVRHHSQTLGQQLAFAMEQAGIINSVTVHVHARPAMSK